MDGSQLSTVVMRCDKRGKKGNCVDKLSDENKFGKTLAPGPKCLRCAFVGMQTKLNSSLASAASKENHFFNDFNFERVPKKYTIGFFKIFA